MALKTARRTTPIHRPAKRRLRNDPRLFPPGPPLIPTRRFLKSTKATSDKPKGAMEKLYKIIKFFLSAQSRRKQARRISVLHKRKQAAIK